MIFRLSSAIFFHNKKENYRTTHIEAIKGDDTTQ